MSAHTEGPWTLCAHLEDHDQCSCGYRGGIWGADGNVIVCEMGGPSGKEGDEMIPRADRETQFKDARLIAAAPEMLEKGKTLVDRDCTYDGGNIIIPCGSHAEALRIMQEFRSSLARAEGRHP